MHGNEQIEKTRKRTSYFRNHPRVAQVALSKTLKKSVPKPPALQGRKIHLNALEDFGLAAREAMARHGIGSAEIADLSLRGGRMVIEIVYFAALDRVGAADVIGHCDGGALQLVSVEVGPSVRVCWKRPSSLGLLRSQTHPGDGHD